MKYEFNKEIYKLKLKTLGTRDKVLFHKHLVDLLEIKSNHKILDLGCGYGNTLLYIAEKLNKEGRAIGVDIDESSLAVAEKILHTKISDGVIKLIKKDLSKPLPFKASFFDRIVCHNVLECIADNVAFINRGYGLLKKGGIMIVSHNDWDSQIYNSSYVELSRKLIHHYADTTQEWMRHSDGTIGRKLRGIFARTKFTHFSAETYTVVNDRFGERDYGYRIAQDIIKVAKGSGQFTSKELKMWLADLKEKDRHSDYYYSGNINLIIATK
jgi:ubiquinone/menaquinone biosynthesis C-methylase UbiE